jgi:hypothetical protein
VGTESHGSLRIKTAGLPAKVARFFVGAPKADVRGIKHRVSKIKLLGNKK